MMHDDARIAMRERVEQLTVQQFTDARYQVARILDAHEPEEFENLMQAENLLRTGVIHMDSLNLEG